MEQMLLSRTANDQFRKVCKSDEIFGGVKGLEGRGSGTEREGEGKKRGSDRRGREGSGGASPHICAQNRPCLPAQPKTLSGVASMEQIEQLPGTASANSANPTSECVHLYSA